MKSKIPVLKEKNKTSTSSASSSDNDVIHLKFDKISKVKDNKENVWNYKVLKEKGFSSKTSLSQSKKNNINHTQLFNKKSHKTNKTEDKIKKKNKLSVLNDLLSGPLGKPTQKKLKSINSNSNKVLLSHIKKVKSDNDIVYAKKYDKHDKFSSNIVPTTTNFNNNIPFTASKKYKSSSFIPISKNSKFPQSKASSTSSNKNSDEMIEDDYELAMEDNTEENTELDIESESEKNEHDINEKQTDINTISPMSKSPSVTPPSSYFPPASSTTTISNSPPMTENHSELLSKETPSIDEEEEYHSSEQNLNINYSSPLEFEHKRYASSTTTNSASYLFNNSSEFSLDSEDIMNMNSNDKNSNKTIRSSEDEREVHKYDNVPLSNSSTDSYNNYINNDKNVKSNSNNSEINASNLSSRHSNHNEDDNIRSEENDRTPTPSKINIKNKKSENNDLSNDRKYFNYLKGITKAKNKYHSSHHHYYKKYSQKYHRPYRSLSSLTRKNSEEDDEPFDLSTSMEKLKKRSAPLLRNLIKTQKKENTNNNRQSKNSLSQYKENSEIERIKNRYGSSGYKSSNSYISLYTNPNSYLENASNVTNIISRIDKNIEYFKQNSQTDVEQTLKRLREKYDIDEEYKKERENIKNISDENNIIYEKKKSIGINKDDEKEYQEQEDLLDEFEYKLKAKKRELELNHHVTNNIRKKYLNNLDFPFNDNNTSLSNVSKHFLNQSSEFLNNSSSGSNLLNLNLISLSKENLIHSLNSSKSFNNKTNENQNNDEYDNENDKKYSNTNGNIQKNQNLDGNLNPTKKQDSNTTTNLYNTAIRKNDSIINYKSITKKNEYEVNNSSPKIRGVNQNEQKSPSYNNDTNNDEIPENVDIITISLTNDNDNENCLSSSTKEPFENENQKINETVQHSNNSLQKTLSSIDQLLSIKEKYLKELDREPSTIPMTNENRSFHSIYNEFMTENKNGKKENQIKEYKKEEHQNSITKTNDKNNSLDYSNNLNINNNAVNGKDENIIINDIFSYYSIEDKGEKNESANSIQNIKLDEKANDIKFRLSEENNLKNNKPDNNDSNGDIIKNNKNNNTSTENSFAINEQNSTSNNDSSSIDSKYSNNESIKKYEKVSKSNYHEKISPSKTNGKIPLSFDSNSKISSVTSEDSRNSNSSKNSINEIIHIINKNDCDHSNNNISYKLMKAPIQMESNNNSKIEDINNDINSKDSVINDDNNNNIESTPNISNIYSSEFDYKIDSSPSDINNNKYKIQTNSISNDSHEVCNNNNKNDLKNNSDSITTSINDTSKKEDKTKVVDKNTDYSSLNSSKNYTYSYTTDSHVKSLFNSNESNNERNSSKNSVKNDNYPNISENDNKSINNKDDMDNIINSNESINNFYVMSSNESNYNDNNENINRVEIKSDSSNNSSINNHDRNKSNTLFSNEFKNNKISSSCSKSLINKSEISSYNDNFSRNESSCNSEKDNKYVNKNDDNNISENYCIKGNNDDGKSILSEKLNYAIDDKDDNNVNKFESYLNNKENEIDISNNEAKSKMDKHNGHKRNNLIIKESQYHSNPIRSEIAKFNEIKENINNDNNNNNDSFVGHKDKSMDDEFNFNTKHNSFSDINTTHNISDKKVEMIHNQQELVNPMMSSNNECNCNEIRKKKYPTINATKSQSNDIYAFSINNISLVKLNMNNANLQISSMSNLTNNTNLSEARDEPIPNYISDFSIKNPCIINQNNQENDQKFSFSHSTSNKKSSSNIHLYRNLFDDTLSTQNSEMNLTKTSTSTSQDPFHNNLVSKSYSNQNCISNSFLQFISSQIQYYQNEILLIDQELLDC